MATQERLSRPAHRLRHNIASTRPEHMVFVDTETHIKPGKNRTKTYPFRLGVARYWRKRRDNRSDSVSGLRFREQSEFWDFLEAHTYDKSVTYLIAHNVLFDLAALRFLEELPARGWECKFAYDAPRCSLYKFRNGRKTLYCVDNNNIFRGALGDWAQAIGLPKVVVDFDDASDTELWLRCEHDVEIMCQLWRWWLTFLDSHDLGTFKPTVASQAFAAYRHRFMMHPVYIHSELAVLELERASYRGGRTEPFRIGKFVDGPWYKLDINSMYPSVMKRYEYPNALYKHGQTCTVGELRWYVRRYGVIAEVDIGCDEPWFPVRRNGYNVFPTGQFTTTLTTEEIKLALNRNWVTGVGRFALYRMRDLFSEFVDYFYELKVQYARERSEVLRQVVKDMLNSLHGKFGQRGIISKALGAWDHEDHFVVSAHDRESGELYTIRYMAGQVIEERKHGEAFNSFAGIAAHVAANARLELYRLVLRAGRGHCVYCDTDCLIVDSQGMEALGDLVHPTDLGKLKLEEVAPCVEIRAPKDYTIGDTRVVKGVPRKARWLDESSAEVEMWPGLNSYLRADPPQTYQTRTVVRTLRRFVNYGWVEEDGWVRPFEYPMDQEAQT